ncbi:MAG TPA: hypothetical protein VNM24_06840 [Burkholderiales bacterium]|nr:hypothetical protein [Burkholderiales bacterium]
MSIRCRLGVCALLVAFAAPVSAQEAAQEDETQRYRGEAIDRLIDSHDFTLIAGAGRLFLKQSAIKAADRLIGQWGREAGLGMDWDSRQPAWQQARGVLLERAERLLLRRFDSQIWVRDAWSAYLGAAFSGEEADHIADHFATEGGREQRRLMDWFLGEFVLFNYTFTERIQYDMPGAQEELRRLQRAAQERLPREDVHFTTRFEDTLAFIGRDPGLKYWKMLAIPLLGEILRRIDSMAREIETEMQSGRSEVQPLIDGFAAAS